MSKHGKIVLAPLHEADDWDRTIDHAPAPAEAPTADVEEEDEQDYPDYGYPIDWAAVRGFRVEPGKSRTEGWTPDKQRLFLEGIAGGITVGEACEMVDLSRQSAYLLRQSPRGGAFALGWQAAVLISRDALADTLMERALNGQTDTVIKEDDGNHIERKRIDNRLGVVMLHRLDRMADREIGSATYEAARLVAADWAQFLDLIERDAGPARAGLFVAARAEPAAAADLAPLRTLARADSWLRTHTDLADAPATADLVPEARGTWTGEQWNRAEAAGLVTVAPQPVLPCQAAEEPMPDPQADAPVWWCDIAREWRTSFPPPADFYGYEEGDRDLGTYERELTDEEAMHFETDEQYEARELAEAEAERDTFFAKLTATHAEAAEGDTAPPSSRS